MYLINWGDLGALQPGTTSDRPVAREHLPNDIPEAAQRAVSAACCLPLDVQFARERAARSSPTSGAVAFCRGEHRDAPDSRIRDTDTQ